MNCRTARKQIALLVGDDLSQPEAAELMVHLRACPECAENRREMGASSGVLSACNDEPVRRDHESLWPDVRANLQVMEAYQPPRRRLAPGSVMAVAVAVCVTFAAIAPDLFHADRPAFSGQTMPVSTTGEADRSEYLPLLLIHDDYVPVYSDPSWQALELLQRNRAANAVRAQPGPVRDTAGY